MHYKATRKDIITLRDATCSYGSSITLSMPFLASSALFIISTPGSHAGRCRTGQISGYLSSLGKQKVRLTSRKEVKVVQSHVTQFVGRMESLRCQCDIRILVGIDIVPKRRLYDSTSGHS